MNGRSDGGHGIGPDRIYEMCKRGQCTEAVVCCDLILENNPDNLDIVCIKGFALSCLGRLREAIEFYDLALQIYPDCMYALLKKSHALYGLGRANETFACIERALDSDPENLANMDPMGTIMDREFRRVLMLEAYKRMLTIDPGNPCVEFSIWYLEQGQQS